MPYSTNITTVMETISNTVYNMIQDEIHDEGILSDVETLITSYQHDNLEEPLVWIHELETKPYKEEALADKMMLRTPFEFICVVYDDDTELAEKKSKNLASRIVAAILKNYRRRVADDLTFVKIELNTFYPVGELPVENKQDVVPVTGVQVDFIYRVDWLHCIRN